MPIKNLSFRRFIGMLILIFLLIPAICLSTEKQLKTATDESLQVQECDSSKGGVKAWAKDWGPIISPFATLLSALAALFVALYLGILREKIRKPRLKLYFLGNGQYPYFFRLSFGHLKDSIRLSTGDTIELLVSGFSARVKVKNIGKTTAKEIQARIEKIEFIDPERPTTFYHPTAVKWSGEQAIGTVDIVSGSHFFLDIFFAINTTAAEMARFNIEEMAKNDVVMTEERVMRIFKEEVQVTEEVFWNVWVKDPHVRGIPAKFKYEGNFVISYVVNGANCEPIKFNVLVDWRANSWNNPTIRIEQNSNYIENEEDN